VPKATTERLRQRPIVVTIAGELDIECRLPDPVDLISANVLPLEVYADVIESIQRWADSGQAGHLAGDTPKQWITLLDFMDRWCMAAAVSPRLVATTDEVTGDDTVWIGDLDMDDKVAIWVKTNKRFKNNPRLGDAQKSFRDVQPAGLGVGSDSAEVRDETIDAAPSA